MFLCWLGLCALVLVFVLLKFCVFDVFFLDGVGFFIGFRVLGVCGIVCEVC